MGVTVYEAYPSPKILLISSATGVLQGYYRKFAQFVQAQGITVITFDYQGIGASKQGHVKQHTNRAADWGLQDLNTVIEYTRKRYPNAHLTIMGHSIGGQLLGITEKALDAQKIVLVTSSSGYWRLYPGFLKYRMAFNWYVVFPFFTRVFGYVPSKRIMGMENLPKRVARQWRYWCTRKNYMLDDASIPPAHYPQFTVPLTAFSVDDDTYAPKRACDWLADQYQNTEQKRIHLVPEEFGVKKISHFGIFKQRHEKDIWPLLLQEIG